MTLIILYQNKNKDKKTTWLATRALLVFASKAIKQIQIPALTHAILRGYKICPTNFTGSLKKHPLLFLRPTFSWYYNVIVGPKTTISVRSSKIHDLKHWGRIICSTISLSSNIKNNPIGLLMTYLWNLDFFNQNIYGI